MSRNTRLPSPYSNKYQPVTEEEGGQNGRDRRIMTLLVKLKMDRPNKRSYDPSKLAPCVRELLAVLVPRAGLRPWMERFPDVYTIHYAPDGKRWRFSIETPPPRDPSGAGGGRGGGRRVGLAPRGSTPPSCTAAARAAKAAGGDPAVLGLIPGVPAVPAVTPIFSAMSGQAAGSAWGQSGVSADGPQAPAASAYYNQAAWGQYGASADGPQAPAANQAAWGQCGASADGPQAPVASADYNQATCDHGVSVDGPQAPAASAYYSQVSQVSWSESASADPANRQGESQWVRPSWWSYESWDRRW